MTHPPPQPPPAALPSAAKPRLLRLTKEGWRWLLLALGLAAAGLYKGINLVTLLAYVMLTLTWLNWRLGQRQARRLRARRWVGALAFARSPLEVVVEVRNPDKSSCIGVRVEDRGAAHECTWFLNELAAGEHRRFRHKITLPRRGWYDWQPVRVGSSFPFGFVDSVASSEAASPLLVYPALGRLHRGRLRRFLEFSAAMPGRARSKLQYHAAAQAEFHGLREFRAGDSPRWIHWRTSARRGSLMVREFEELPSEHLILVLDPWLPEPATDKAQVLLERAVSLSATICWEWCRQKGDQFVLAVVADVPSIHQGTTGLDLAHEILGGLALVSGTRASNADNLVDRVLNAELPRAPILVVSTRGGEIAAALSRRLHRRVAALDVSDLDRYDFYEEPTRL